MKISIIIVHFFGEAHLVRCLNSIPKHPSISELIVVDNGSEKGFAVRTSSIRKGTVTISNEKNIGYSAAVNKAAQISTGDVLLILNQDIVFHENTLNGLLQCVGQDENTHIWGAQLLNTDGTKQGSAGPFPTLSNWLLGLFKPKAQRKYYSPPPDHSVDWVTGAFLAIRRNCFETLTGFDEGYFMYYEDVDLCMRAAQNNCKTALAENIVAVHSAPITEQKKVAVELAIQIRRSQLRYFQKHRPHWEYAALVWITRFYFFLKGWKFR